ncbi:MAG: hypothetical protein Roseis2KO_33950 [Roseivirga sp.]
MRFVEGEFYHVYNRGNNRFPIFFEDENYEFFLKKIKREVLPLCDILAYCLMPNHYHFLIVVKEQVEDSNNEMDILSRKLGTLQSSYTRAINKRFNRVGSLFQAKLKKKHASDYADICFHYIHQNPVVARLCDKLEDWKFSSFKDYYFDMPNDLLNKDLARDLLDIPQNSDLFYKESLGVINSEYLDQLWS